MALATDPNAPATPDATATTGQVKKAPAALPLASPNLSSASNPTATTQPVGPVTPAGPATTSDPMAFAPNGGGTPAIAADPLAGAAGSPVTAGYTGWQDGLGNTAAGPSTTPANGDPMAEHLAALTAASTASGWNAPGMKYDGQAGHYDNTDPTPVKIPGLNGVPETTPDGMPLNGLPPTSKLTPGPASDVNPGGQLPLGTPQLSATTGPAGVPGSGTGHGLNGLPATTSLANGTVSATPTDPSNPLTMQTLSVGPTADRFRLAQDELQQFRDAGEPQYAADLRKATAQGFGAGRGVSGQLRSSLGDIASNRDLSIRTQGNTLLDNALEGTIGDAYKNVGIEQQQQQFQAGQQQTGFNQGVTLQQLSDTENNQSFQHAYQQALLGYSGDPATLYMQMAAQWAKTGATA